MKNECEEIDFDAEILKAREIIDIFKKLPRRIEPPIPSKSILPFWALALREVLAHRTAELGEVAVDLFEKRKIVSAFIIVRSIQETFAMLYSLHEHTKNAVDSEDTGKLEIFLKKALFGWKNNKDDDYSTFPKAHQILNAIDLVDKKLIPHFRNNYESLSEFAHPNWSGCLGAYSKFDNPNIWLDLGAEVRSVPIAIGFLPFINYLELSGSFYDEIGNFIMPMQEICER